MVDDRVEPRPVLRVCCTTDHRIVDGYFGAILVDELRRMLSEPAQLLTAEERTAWLAPDPDAPAPSR